MTTTNRAATRRADAVAMAELHRWEESGSQPPRGTVLSFRAARRTYVGPPAVDALGPCDLDIAAGEFVTVCGPSGSGKSTWLNLAGLLDRPTSGGVTVNGVATEDLSDSARTAIRGAWFGFVFQAFHLMPRRSVWENMAIPAMYRGWSPDRRDEQVRRAAEAVGLGHRIGAEARHLSGGEMQRVAIARALVTNPLILLCDEPTGNLDQENGARIIELLDRVHETGSTVVVITHDPQVAAHGGHRLRIVDGQVHEAA